MYAIAVVDLRAGRRLRLWCDPLAVKSLYYRITDDGVVFSSELDGLTAQCGAALPLDPAAVDHYLNWQCLPGGATWYRGVGTLRPGERLEHDGRRALLRAAPAPAPVTPDGTHGPRALRELLDRETARMCLQESPVALQLSGGLDSAILAGLLSAHRSDVTGFHVTHEGTHDSDEERYARVAAAHAGIPLEVVEVREAEVPDLLPAMVRALGTPNATPHALSAYVLFREISAAGFRVCFVGDGADEQFGGYRRYSTALAATDDAWRERYLDRLSLIPHAEYRGLYTPDYRALVDEHGGSRRQARELLDRAAPSRLEQMLTFDRLHKLPALNLRKLDHLSMAHSVEGRVPYCQPEVTAFARRTPDPAKIDGDRRKGVLWDAGSGLVPAEVRGRAKQPFTFPVAHFLRPGGKLWEFTTDILTRPRLCTAGYLNETAVRDVLTAHAAGHDRARLLWGLMVLELSFPGTSA